MAKWGDIDALLDKRKVELKQQANIEALESIKAEYQIAVEEGEHVVAARLAAIIEKMGAELK